MEKLILVRKKKTRKVDNKEQVFYQYSGRHETNENKWLSCNVVNDAQAKLQLDKDLEFPALVELKDGEDYFVTTYERVNQLGEIKRVPKVVIQNYQKISHIDLPSKTLTQVFEEME
ncbi:hypothetical protein [Romboutsia ilealis]|uniref:hypothetical protein n=1 Tax=Romboutsia ilealis TaxID=1115758 RepID=UPI0025711869|nr:hypothetical protein [Romboutsia ilealis]